MKRALTLIVNLALCIGLLGLPVVPAGASDLTPVNVDKLKHGAMQLATWLDSLRSEGDLGRKVPLLGLRLGEALHIGAQSEPDAAPGVFDDSLRTPLSSPPSGTDTVQELADVIAGYSGTKTIGGDQLRVTFTTSGVDDSTEAGDSITGFNLTARVERTVGAAPLAVSVADPELTLKSVDNSGVPVRLAFEAVFELRHNSVGNFFFVNASDAGTTDDTFAAVSDDKPLITATAQSLSSVGGSAGAYTIPATNFKTAIGFGDLLLDEDQPSTLNLNASYVGDVTDSNGDGVLAFQEPGNPGELIDAELTLPRSNNFRTFRQGTATTSVEVDSPFTPADDDAVISVSGAGDLAAGDPVTRATGTDVQMLENFENVRAVDVLSGLIQYATLLRGLQTHPNVDFDLPLLSGRFSEVYQVEQELSTFIDSRIVNLVPGRRIDPDNLVDFDTALQLADKMSTNANGLASLLDTNGDGAGDITPSFADNKLTFDIHVRKTTSAFEDIPEPDLDGDTTNNPPAEQRSEVGIINLGRTLRTTTGLAGGAPLDTDPNSASNTSTNPASQASRKTSFEFHLPLIIDLQDSSPAQDDEETDAIVEFESPMVYERFLVPTASAGELELSGEVRTPITAAGQIGFVRVDIAGNEGESSYRLYPSTEDPILTVDVDATRAGLPATARLSALIDKLVDDDNNALNDVVPSVDPRASAAVSFQMQARSNEGYALTPQPGSVQVNWTEIKDPLPASGVDLEDDTARMLKQLDIVPPPNESDDGDPNALLGKLIDTVQNAATRLEEQLSNVPEVAGVDIIDSEIPLVGKSLRDLLGEVVDRTEQVAGGQNVTRSVSLATQLNEKLDRIRSGPLPASLQVLEQTIQQELNLPPEALNFALKNFGDASSPPELVFRLHWDETVSDQIPLNFDLSLGPIVGVDGSGELNVAGNAALDLNVPVTLTPPGPNDGTSAVNVLNSSGLVFNLNVTDAAGTPQLTANLGPVEIALGDGSHGIVKMGAGFTAFAGSEGAPVDPVNEQMMSMSDFIQSVRPKLNGGAGSPFQCAPESVDQDAPDAPAISGAIACATLPVSVNGNPVGGNTDASYLTADIDGLAANQIDIDPPDGLATAVAGEALNLASLEDGLDKIMAILNLALQGATYGAELPLIGDEIAAGAAAVEEFRTFVNGFSVPGLGNPAETSVSDASQQLRNAIAAAMPSGILRDSDYASTGTYYTGDPLGNTDPDAGDIRVTMTCGSSNCLGTQKLVNVDRLTVEFEVGQGPRDVTGGNCAESPALGSTACQAAVNIPIDIGLPGINFGRPDGPPQQVQARAGWTLQVGFGLDRARGFFIMDNPMPSSGTGDNYNSETEQELQVGFGVGFQQNPAADELSAQIGFLDVGIEDKSADRTGADRYDDPADTDDTESHPSALTALLTNDMRSSDAADPVCLPVGAIAANQSCSKWVTADQLLNLQTTDLFAPQIAADADIDLRLVSGLAGTVGEKLPKIRADLVMNWRFGNGAPAADPSDTLDCQVQGDGGDSSAAAVPITAGTPAVCFENVKIDPGTLYAETLEPIFSEIKGITEPVDPIREFIFSPTPIVSDVSKLFGGPDVTYADLAGYFGDFDPKLLEDINALMQLISSFPTGGGQFLQVGDGNFQLDGGRALGAPVTPEQANDLIKSNETATSLLNAAKDAIPAGQSDRRQKFERALNKNNEEAGDSSPDITIPILEQPDCIFGMLFGGDCVLFEYNPDPLRMEFNYEQPFGPFFGVLYVTVGGFAGAQARISVGYDTRGFRELFHGGVQNAGAGTLLNGIFIRDTLADGSDPAELEVWAGITAGAKLSVLIAEAGARGGIQATMGLNWHDGPEIDGVLRINEIIRKIHVPFCLFDVQGRLEAFLEVYLEVGVCPLCAEYAYELARIILLDFSEGFCPNKDPVLAEPESEGSQTIVLNVGTRADERSSPGADWGESVLGPDENYSIRQVGANKFSITAFGYTEIEHGSRFLIPDADDGNDVFVFEGAKAGAEQGETTDSDENATAPFGASVTATLGSGNDSIVTGNADDTIIGGTGNDTISTGGGVDSITAGPDAVEIDGAGQEVPDNDSVTAGDGADSPVRGGYGNDTLDGGIGEDTLTGGLGNDRLDGGRDVIVRPDQATPCDTVPAGDPCDTIDVRDTLTGGPGRDQIDGGNGGDLIFGDEGSIAVLFGGDGHVPASDGANDDVITGGLGEDRVFAGNGADKVNGGGSEATVDDSVDRLWGNGGPDELSGSNGNDVIRGGSGADTLKGELHDDDLFGDAGDDHAYGGAGTDDIHGGADDDELFGDADDDNLFGEADEDSLFGSDGDDDLDGGPGDDRQEDGGGLFGETGDDDIVGGPGRDDLFGGVGIDFMMGDEGVIDDTDPANRTGAPGEASGEADRLFGENAADVMWGEGDNDELQGGPSGDLMFGNAGDDTMLGQTGADRMIGGSARDDASDTGDEMYGGTETDTMIGDNGVINPVDLGPTGLSGTFGDDTMNGGPHEDLMYGQEGSDTMYGAEDFDRMFGNLGGDHMYGQTGADYMLGDSGTVAPEVDDEGGLVLWPGGAPRAEVSLDAPDDTENPNDGGVDTMDGGDQDDHMWGGAANDIMGGGFDDDYMEGNNGQDSMYGNASDAESPAKLALNLLLDGQDDMIGGSSPVNPLADTAAGAPDEGEIVMHGNARQDVITGDNAIIDPITNGAEWAIDNITLGRKRDVTLLDTEKSGDALDLVSGGDTILGNGDNDRIYGEGGNDCAKGNGEEDYLEGNQDRDWVEGNDHQDDIIGGSDGEAQPDHGDYLFGGADSDVIAGDNAVITRDPAVPGGPYYYVTDRIQSELATKRHVKLLDLANASFSLASGSDQISGGSGTDVSFGQDLGDWITGNSAGDYMEGNGASDFLWGDRTLEAVNAAPPEQLAGGIPAPIAELAGCASEEAQLIGPAPYVDGQDDQIGGSSIKNHREANDYLFGDGAQDFQLGDNGQLLRRKTDDDSAYLVYEDYNPTTFKRQANRFDVNGPAEVFGDDYFEGNDGDDYQWGQDGNDVMHGNAQNDDMFGELGGDFMYGETGEDAMLGDRGKITDDLILADDPDDPQQFTIKTSEPPFLTYTAFRPNTLHRSFDLLKDGDGDMDGDGDPVEFPGLTVGGSDFMRGGPDHDSMHGAFNDDLMNGDEYGDILFGDDGADAIWGGKGSSDPAEPDARGTNDSFVDYIFGGYGGDPTQNQGIITGGADIIDYRPRPGTNPADPADGSPDPRAWFEITSTIDDSSDPSSRLNNSHHQGIDWIYGGWDRDVLQGNVADNGPNEGDRLMDWNGAYNLYTHCNAAYGGYNDIRAHHPTILDFLQRFAYATGAGSSLSEVLTAGTSAFRELALVYPKDSKFNSDKAYPTTPGHFDQISCVD